MNSAIYRGWVRHRRFGPRPHAFTYRMLMLLLDLDELDMLNRSLRLFSTDSAAPARFRRSDHWGDPEQPLKDSILDLVAERAGERPRGAVRLLTQPRFWGIGFNPISIYYCYDRDDRSLQAVVAEVTNTPWGERHCYVLPGAVQGRSMTATFDKALHVSPFMASDQEYRWRGRAPGDTVAVHLESFERGEMRLDATLSLLRLPLTSRNLATCIVSYPFSTAKVVAAIHWEALRLVLKKTPFHAHPRSVGSAEAAANVPSNPDHSRSNDHRTRLETSS